MNKHISIGMNKIDGQRTERGIRYYAHEINAYVTVREADVARLGAVLLAHGGCHAHDFAHHAAGAHHPHRAEQAGGGIQ